ncbi:response regulator [Sinomonas sp. ASV322]|uniref:hybrid sensor histidine kinase/response regulator n=1 Tax=Sinomonas sp. ASV322 TaxID=3041920 RepID=UPI0027DB4413|nr:response regulator [Sinomonas sp. ASV322]MDQ4503508.1 response regulator [Sinomonas sp. ASV322]
MIDAGQHPKATARGTLWGIIAGAAALAAVVVVVASDPGSGSSQTIGDFGILAAALAGTASCARAAARRGPEARAWLWISFAALIWSTAQAIWTGYGLATDHDYPFPSLADAGFVGYSVPAIVGLLSFPRARASRVGLARTLLDTAVIAAAVLFVSWSIVLGPLVGAGSHDLLTRLTGLAYPVVDVTVASFVLVLTMRQTPGHRLPWLCLAAGLIILTVTDSTYVRLTFDGATGTTGTLMAGGWMAAFLLMALAAAVPRRSAPGKDHAVYALAFELLPYAPVLGAIVISSSSLAEGNEAFLLGTGVVLLALVVARQVLIVFENVTLTRGLEAKVAQRTAELEGLAAIVNSSSEAIVGKTTGAQITSWNRGAEHVYGYAAAEAIGRDHSFLIPDHRRAFEEENFEAVRAGGATRSYETERLRPDGTLVPVAITAFPVRGDHGIHGMATIAQDITERRRTEAELLAAREAALESSRLKSEFMATMSHEIRTPMNGVIGLTGLLLQTRLDEAQRQYAEGVKTAGEALLALINDILDFSKLEAGKVELDPMPFEPRALLDEVAGLFAEQAQGKGLELIAHCRPNVPPLLLGDSRALRQILLNLVSNAVKFTSQGEVSLVAKLQGEGPDDARLRFEVRDTGIGIAPEQQELIFDAFAQADASTTRQYGGTGLGLAICRRLTEALGGEIGLTSQLGAGSVFWVAVPVSVLAADASASEPPLAPFRAGLRVLVVDDNATNRLVLERQLAAWGMEPESTEDAAGALELLGAARAQGLPFELAILDLCMPGPSGLDLTRTIRAEAAIASIPVIILTSAGQPDRAEFERAGVQEWLSKPVRSSELFDRVSRLLAPASAPAGQAPAATAPLRASARGRVLVVEDNEVNQLVAKSMAEKLGYDVDLVTDGAQAVEATARVEYAAVLMDCHMPVMDGFDATRRIRARGGSGAALPIIAMTAGASDEDRERCLAAGMDDYLSKPVDMSRLEAALDHWTIRAEFAPAGEHRPEPAPESAVDGDRLDMLRSLGSGVLEATVEAFEREVGAGLESLRRASSRGGSSDLHKAAHKLKGSAGNIGAERAAELCRELEELGRQGGTAAPDQLDELEAELARVSESLRRALLS